MAAHSILLVEDDVWIRMDLAHDFRRRGFIVIEASNASDALVELNSWQVDLVFTDIQMPGSMNGLDFARLVLAQTPWLPVAVTSGNLELLEAAKSIATAGIFPKPIDTMRTIDKLITVLGSKTAPGVAEKG